jgi:hypothetical protein
MAMLEADEPVPEVEEPVPEVVPEEAKLAMKAVGVSLSAVSVAARAELPINVILTLFDMGRLAYDLVKDAQKPGRFDVNDDGKEV